MASSWLMETLLCFCFTISIIFALHFWDCFRLKVTTKLLWIFQSRLWLKLFVIFSEHSRKFCYLQIRDCLLLLHPSQFIIPSLWSRVNILKETRRRGYFGRDSLPGAPSERSCSRFHWDWTGWKCSGNCCRDERGRWTSPCACCDLSSFGQPRACKTQ